MKIIGYHIAEGAIVSSEGEACDKMSYLEFLLQPKPDTIRMMYSLEYNVFTLIKMLHLLNHQVSTLMADTLLYFKPYHLRYVEGKFFSVKRPNAFAYYADASQYVQYPVEDLALPAPVLACRAKEIGERVYKVLQELGFSPTSLTSPARAYEKAQLKWLYEKRAESNGDPVRRGIIDAIGSGIYGESWRRCLESTR